MTQRRLGLRLLPILAISATVAAAAAGCSSDTPKGGAEPQTITLAFGPADDQDAKQWDALADAYQKAHPGVTIKRERLPGESWAQVIQTRVQGGNAPDLFEVKSGGGQVGSLVPLAKAGLLLPLTDPTVKANQPAGSDPSQWTYDGKVYGVPTNIAVNGLVFNAEAAKSVGVNLTSDTSMDDLIAQCAKVQSAGKEMFVSAGAVPVSTEILALTLATSTVYGPDPDWNAKRASNQVTFAGTQGWKGALATIKRMSDGGCFQKGVAGAGFDAIVKESTTAKALGLFSPSGAATALMNTSGGKIKLVVEAVPAPSGYKTFVSISSDFSIAGSNKTKSPKLVADFLTFLASKEGAAAFANTQGSIPAVGADKSSLLPQYQPVANYLSSSDMARGWPPITWTNGKVLDDLGSGVQGLMTGQKSVDQVLKQMDTDW